MLLSSFKPLMPSVAFCVFLFYFIFFFFRFDLKSKTCFTIHSQTLCAPSLLSFYYIWACARFSYEHANFYRRHRNEQHNNSNCVGLNDHNANVHYCDNSSDGFNTVASSLSMLIGCDLWFTVITLQFFFAVNTIIFNRMYRNQIAIPKKNEKLKSITCDDYRRGKEFTKFLSAFPFS